MRSENKVVADRRKLAYILKFILLGWTVIAVLTGMVVGLAYLLQDTTLTILVVQFIVYSGAFGLMGWQHYKTKDKRRAWHFDERGVKGWISNHGKSQSGEWDEAEDADSGWRQ